MEILIWNYIIGSAAVAMTWIVWLWKDRQALPVWRRRVTVAGIGAVSINAAAFWAVVISRINIVSVVFRFEPVVDALLVAALLCAICGKGASRGLLALCSVLGFFFWIVPGIL